MINIVLDTNIIILYPKILGLQIPGIHFIVPIDVISELNNRATQKGKSFDDRVDLIEKSAAEGTVTILNTDLPGFRRYFDLINYNRIAGADYSLIVVALKFQERGENVKIATLDKEVQNIARNHNLEVLTKEGIENLISSFKEPTAKIPFSKKLLEILLTVLRDVFPLFPVFDNLIKSIKLNFTGNNATTVQDKIISYERKEKVNLIVGIIIGIASTLLAIFIYKNIGVIVKNINVWGTIVLIVITGIVLFVFREKQRLSYGIFEFLVGVAAIVLLFLSDNFDYSKIKFSIDFNVKLLGGLYIMVRGQDNIVKALKDTKLGIRLKKIGIGL